MFQVKSRQRVRKEHADCLQDRVQRVFPTTTVMHRLDIATFGLMMMALNKPAHRHLSKQFERRDTAKTYHVIVFDEVQQDSGKISLPLICDWANCPKQMVEHERGKKRYHIGGCLNATPSQQGWN